jgi:hypothetical protein
MNGITADLVQGKISAAGDFDMLLLGCYLCRDNDLAKYIFNLVNGFATIKTDKQDNAVFTPSGFMGTHGYCITNRGAKKCLKQQIYGHVDFLLGRWGADGIINLRALRTPLVCQNWDSSETATIYSKLLTFRGIPLEYLATQATYEVFGVSSSPFNIIVFVIFITLISKFALEWRRK